jgi:hypothetical protein
MVILFRALFRAYKDIGAFLGRKLNGNYQDEMGIDGEIPPQFVIT